MALLAEVRRATADVHTGFAAESALPKVVILAMDFAEFLLAATGLFGDAFWTQQFFGVDSIKGKGLGAFVLASEKRSLVVVAHVEGHLASDVESFGQLFHIDFLYL